MNLRRVVLATLAAALTATASAQTTTPNEKGPVVSSGQIRFTGAIADNGLYRPRWTWGAFVTGGTGLNERSDIQFANLGARFGRVLTSTGGAHWYSGSLEYNAELIPYTHYFWKGETSFDGFAVNPFIWKWNFVRRPSQKFVPLFLAHGGFVRTAKDMPPGDTSNYNFTSGAGVGFHYFVSDRKSINFDLRALHLSNASLGNHNPGVNASLQFSLGFNWFGR